LTTLRERWRGATAAGLAAAMEAGLPLHRSKPADLLQDEHLLETGGTAVCLPDEPKAGETVKTTLFPITMGEAGSGANGPAPGGRHTATLLEELGYYGHKAAAPNHAGLSAEVTADHISHNHSWRQAEPRRPSLAARY
jgi:crotonobetainyl-CoA:carnitine CoA-transferase CaiB-like acyl-CoA transferase